MPSAIVSALLFSVIWVARLADFKRPIRGSNPLNVILDTDIGQDIDDSWAIALTLKRMHDALNLHLITTAAHDTFFKAKIIAKWMEEAGTTEIPIGIGVKQDTNIGPLKGWAEHVDLSKYPGGVHSDGVAEMARTIEKVTDSGEELYVLSIGPMANLESLTKRFPDAAKKLGGIIAMSGSVFWCYGRATKGPCKEYNVCDMFPASQVVYAYPWLYFASTPVDTCSLVHLDGDLYQRLRGGLNKTNPILDTLMETWCYWCGNKLGADCDCTKSSSTLFDPVAVSMAVAYPQYGDVWLSGQVEKMGVNDSCVTVVDEAHGQPVWEALNWVGGDEGLKNWEEWLVDQLLG